MKKLAILIAPLIFQASASAHTAIVRPPCERFDPSKHDMIMKEVITDMHHLWLNLNGIKIGYQNRNVMFTRPFNGREVTYISPEPVIPLNADPDGELFIRMYLGEDMMWYEVRSASMQSAPTLNALMFFGIDRDTEERLAQLAGSCGFSSTHLKEVLKSGLIKTLDPFPPLNSNYTPAGWVAVTYSRSM